MAAILICIVSIFLLSNIPRVVLNCFEFLMIDVILRYVSDVNFLDCLPLIYRCGDQFIPPNWFLCLASFNNLALVFNASVNRRKIFDTY